MADLKRTVDLWFSKAHLDLRTAKLVLEAEPPLFEPAVFHCQQAAEKAIKGYLAFNKVRFNKTHSIKELLNLVATVKKSLADQLAAAEILTKYAVAYRYPEEIENLEPLNKSSAQLVYELAQTVYEQMFNKI